MYPSTTTGTSSSTSSGTSSSTTTINNSQLTINNNPTSDTLTIYRDTQAPNTPSILNISSPSYSPIVGINLANNTQTNQGFGNTITPINPTTTLTNQTQITKDTNISVSTNSEKLSDTQFQVYSPSGVIQNPSSVNAKIDNLPYSALNQANYTGDATTNLQLGNTSRDEDQTNCTTISNTPIKNRKLGTCSDGLYTVNTRSIDTAGNPSGFVSTVVERDTVSPVAPVVSVRSTPVEYGLRERIGISITGEADTVAHVEISNNAGFSRDRYPYLGTSGNYDNEDLLNTNLDCGGVVYTVKVRLTDRAKNTSSYSQEVTLTTKACPSCTGTASSQGFINPINHPQVVLNANNQFRTTARPNHGGIDVAITGDPNGIIPILAVKDGRVSLIDTDQYGGYYIDIDHGGGLTTRYLHLSSPASNFVSLNQQITQGTQIGLMGSTGLSDGPHLHWSVLQGQSGSWDATAINPATNLYDCNKGVLGAGDESQNTNQQPTDPNNPNPTNPNPDEDYKPITCYPIDMTGFVGPIGYIDPNYKTYCYTDSNEDKELEVQVSNDEIAGLVNWGALEIPKEVDEAIKSTGVNFKAEVVKCALQEQSPTDNNQNLIDQARSGFSDLVGFVPAIGDLGDSFIAATGQNILSGKQVSCIERFLSGIFGTIGLTLDAASGSVTLGFGAFFSSFSTEVVEKGILGVIKDLARKLTREFASIQAKELIEKSIRAGIKEGVGLIQLVFDNLANTSKAWIKSGNDFFSVDLKNLISNGFAVVNGSAIAKITGKKVVKHTASTLIDLFKSQWKNIDFSVSKYIPEVGYWKIGDPLPTNSRFATNVDNLINNRTTEVRVYSIEEAKALMIRLKGWSKHAPKDDAVKQFDKLFDPPHTGSDVATDLEKEFIHINAQSDSVSSFTVIISNVKP